MQDIKFPLSTSETAALLSVPEFSIQNQIRLGKANPGWNRGKRAWLAADVLKVAHILGKDSLEVRNAISKAQKCEVSK